MQLSAEGVASPEKLPSPGSRALPLAAVVTVLSGLAGAWIAAGSVGLLGHPLRRGLVWVALAAAIIAAWPRQAKTPFQALLLLAAAAAAVAMIASPAAPVHVLAVALVLAVLACGESGAARKTIGVAAEAVTVLGVFYLARTSIGPVWLAADAVGRYLGSTVERVTGQPLWVGATFAGIDYLVTMLYLVVRFTLSSRRPIGTRLALAAVCVLAVLAGHLVYRAAVSLAAGALLWPPEASQAAAGQAGGAAPTVAEQVFRALVPWNLPALGAVIHAAIAGAILWWLPGAEQSPELPPKFDGDEKVVPPRGISALGVGYIVTAVAVLLAVVLPILTTLSTGRPDLTGKKIVIYKEGFLNWLKPEHGDYGRLSIGMYGMMPAYLESLGARAVISPELSAEDLADADALILLYPDKHWVPGQLDRIWKFVRDGGSLLVMGEHTICEEDGGSRVNEVIEPTAMRVRFDSATFAVGGWLQSYEALAHPTSAGIADDQNQFGAVIGASVRTRYPARPLLVGRWGWADPGSKKNKDGSFMGNHRYDPGEKLGDLILAAEQPLGKGKVIVFGDTSGLTNGLTIGCHQYTSRLMAYVADRSRGPAPLWREAAGVGVAVTLLVLLFMWPVPWRPAVVAAGVALSLVFCTRASYRSLKVLPDGRLKTPNNLAYVDAAHLGAFTGESWRDDGTMGLCMTLMRSGYLTLMLPELTAERLDRARLLVSIAPARQYSDAELLAVKRFVEKGGIFILTVGYDRAGPSRRLLGQFGFTIGRPPGKETGDVGEPEPLGYFKAPFFDGGDYYAYVRFHAAWPIWCKDPDALVVSRHPPDKPVIIISRYGKGLVAVVGDTCFAMNKNLEHEGGEPFEGMRENADFWRWFLAMLGEGEPWYPPDPQAALRAGKKEQPPDQQPMEKQPSDEQPTDQQPADGQPMEKQPTDQQPMDAPGKESP